MAKFAEEYVKTGYNGQLAYQRAYEQANKATCSSESWKLLKDKRIIEAIESIEGDFRIIGQSAGIDKATIVRVLADMMNATKQVGGKDVPDYTARKDAITLFSKLTGDFKEKKELEISKKEELLEKDVTKMSSEERAEYEKELLSEL